MDKNQKKLLRQQFREKQRAEARGRFPLPYEELRQLFDMLDTELPHRGCNHTREPTETWLQSKGRDVDSVFTWLDEHGGYCDCEVLANTEQYVEEAMRGSE